MKYLYTFCKKSSWFRGSVLHFKPRGHRFKSHLGYEFLSFMGAMGSNPPLVYINFSFVEITNLYHLWIFNIILDMKQAEKVLGNFGYIKTRF